MVRANKTEKWKGRRDSTKEKSARDRPKQDPDFLNDDTRERFLRQRCNTRELYD